MEQLSALLEQSAHRVVDPYFSVPIAGGRPALRERVYCYELYHQLRCHWPIDAGYVLNGELDKAAHPVLHGRGIGRLKPDLLVHRPGDMNGNHAIIEVKCSNAPGRGIRKDLRSLAMFRQRADYRRAILLIFGNDANRTLARATRIAAELGPLPTIEIWLHPSVGARATYARSVGSC